jgi:diguanylate cyclase (GGDEF)-like protein
VEIAANAADPEFWRPHLDDLLNRRPFRDFVYPYKHHDGCVRWFRISGQPLFSADGGFQGYRGVGTDITVERQAQHELASTLNALEVANATLALQNEALHEANAHLEAEVARRERLEEKLRHILMTDGLTGLSNRALLYERLSEALARPDSGNGGTALLCLDLDRFKAVNDTLGHPAGDVLLKRVASRLRSCASEPATVARLGGDEFAILLTDETDEGADALAATLVREVGRPYWVEDHRLEIGVSVGVALAPRDGTGTDELLKSADLALYRAKADGRGVHRFFEPGMERRATTRPGPTVQAQCP